MRVESTMLRWIVLLAILFLSSCSPPPLKQLAVTIATSDPTPDARAYTPLPTPTTRFTTKSNVSQRDIPQSLRVLESLVELEKARRAFPERHEAIFNEAILLQEYGNYLETENRGAVLQVTIDLFRLYIRQAEADSEAQDAVRIAKERLAGIEQATTCNFKETEADRKQKAAEEKQRAAEAEALVGE